MRYIAAGLRFAKSVGLSAIFMRFFKQKDLKIPMDIASLPIDLVYLIDFKQALDFIAIDP
jgi:hypothetical protein